MRSALQRCWPTLVRRRLQWLRVRILPDGGILFFQRIGGEGCQSGATTGQDTEDRSSQDSRAHATKVGACLPPAIDLSNERFTCRARVEISGDFGETEHSHGKCNKTQTIGQFGYAEDIARNAGVGVDTQQPFALISMLSNYM